MLATAKNWGYSSGEIALRKLVLPRKKCPRSRTFHPFPSRIDSLARKRTVAHVLYAFTATALRGTEKLNPQRAGERGARDSAGSARRRFEGIPFDLDRYPDGWLFATRNNRPPSSNNVVEYRLWPILDALDIPRCGLHAFRHFVASFIVDAGYSPEVAKQQLRHTDARTTLNYIHLRGGITEQAMADVSNSLKLDAVGRGQGKGSEYIQWLVERERWVRFPSPAPETLMTQLTLHG